MSNIVEWGYTDYDAFKQFDGDVIITDPCYLMKKRSEEGRPQWSEFHDVETYQGMTHQELLEHDFYERSRRMDEAYEDWKKEHPDDWEVCEYGENMGALGFKNILVNSTIYGDWSCAVINSETGEVMGEFCADAGLVCVVPLEEVLKYNPDFNDYITKPWTTTLIKDFHGKIAIMCEDDEVKVVGKGNINFESTQVGF